MDLTRSGQHACKQNSKECGLRDSVVLFAVASSVGVAVGRRRSP